MEFRLFCSCRRIEIWRYKMSRAFGSKNTKSFLKAVGLIHIVGMDFNPSTKNKNVKSRRFDPYNAI
jgi:hypothetical protein